MLSNLNNISPSIAKQYSISKRDILDLHISDVDNDGKSELPDGFIVAYNFDGSLVWRFPLIEEYYAPLFGTAVLTDLDNDGDIEICSNTQATIIT